MLVARAGASATPPVPPPRALVRFVNFSRLPEKTLAVVRRVLEEDSDFRARVQAAVTLAEVRAAGWLFLTRPSGWEEELASLAQAAAELRVAQAGEREERSATRRLARAEEARQDAEREAASLRARLAEAGPQLAEERRARRALETDAGRLRVRLAELEADLAVARAAAAAAGSGASEVERLGAALDEAGAALSAERRRAAALEEELRALEGSLEPGAGWEAPRALAAAAAAVGTLAEAVSAAAAQLAPFLPAPPAASPSPSRPTAAPSASGTGLRAAPVAGPRRPPRLPPGVPDDSPQAGEHLVRLPGVVVLVDGYNVTKLAWPDLALPDQRRWLADAAASLAARTGADVELVFDGAEDGGGPPPERPRTKVQVRWSPVGVEADDVLLEMVEGMPAGRPVVVVSNDRRVKSGARQRGAAVLGSDLFLGLIGQRPA